MTTTAHYQAMIQDGALDLTDDKVSDLSPLAGLTGLHRLYLCRADISDLTPLAGLTELHTLCLFYTYVFDLRPLTGLTGLRCLDLYGADVSAEAVSELQHSLPNLTIYR